MEQEIFITEEERKICQRVAEVFAELYEMKNIVVLDVGRYGFVKLQYYKPPHGFEDVITFTDSRSMFEDLWQEWLDTKLYLLAKGTLLLEKGYKGVYESLSKEEQTEIIGRKKDFTKAAGIYLYCHHCDRMKR